MSPIVSLGPAGRHGCDWLVARMAAKAFSGEFAASTLIAHTARVGWISNAFGSQTPSLQHRNITQILPRTSQPGHHAKRVPKIHPNL